MALGRCQRFLWTTGWRVDNTNEYTLQQSCGLQRLGLCGEGRFMLFTGRLTGLSLHGARSSRLRCLTRSFALVLNP